MAISIANVATQDKYADALTLGPIAECVGIKYVVANASVLAQTIAKNKSGTLADWGDEVLITPESNTLQDCDGMRFKSAQPGVPAQVVATLYLPADAKFGSGTPFTANLSASGAISGGGGVQELSYTEKQVNTVLNAGGVTVITAPPLTFDGLTATLVEFFAPLVSCDIQGSGAAQQTRLRLFQDGVDIGTLAEVESGFVGGILDEFGSPVFARRKLTPAAGARTFSVVGLTTFAGQVFAGAGGAGLFLPAYLRITTG